MRILFLVNGQSGKELYGSYIQGLRTRHDVDLAERTSDAWALAQQNQYDLAITEEVLAISRNDPFEGKVRSDRTAVAFIQLLGNQQPPAAMRAILLESQWREYDETSLSQRCGIPVEILPLPFDYRQLIASIKGEVTA